MTMTLSDIISALSRESVQKILEGYGFAVYDEESTDLLKEALEVNVKDDTIPMSELLDELE